MLLDCVSVSVDIDQTITSPSDGLSSSSSSGALDRKLLDTIRFLTIFITLFCNINIIGPHITLITPQYYSHTVWSVIVIYLCCHSVCLSLNPWCDFRTYLSDHLSCRPTHLCHPSSPSSYNVVHDMTLELSITFKLHFCYLTELRTVK